MCESAAPQVPLDEVDALQRDVNERYALAVKAAAEWLMGDDSAYAADPRSAQRAAENMIRVAMKAMSARHAQ